MGKNRKLSLYSRLLILILVLAFFLRVYVAFFSGLRWVSDDTRTYLSMADAIIAGNPISYFPNGLPLLITVFKLIFPAEWVLAALIVLNIVLSTFVVGLCADITKYVTKSNKLALIAGLLIALYPNQLNYVRHLLTEVPSTFLLTFSCFLLFRNKYILSGVTLLIAILFRTSLIPVFPFILICLLFHSNSVLSRAQILKYIAGFLIAFSFYSVLTFTNTVKPSNNLGKNILVSIQSTSQDVKFSTENFSTEEKQNPIRTYFQFAWDKPILFLKQRALSLQELWGWPSIGKPPRMRSFLTRLLIFLRLPAVILAIIGFLIKRKELFSVWVLFIPIITLTIVHVSLFSMPRYNVVIEPITLILAVVGIHEISQKLNINNILRRSQLPDSFLKM